MIYPDTQYNRDTAKRLFMDSLDDSVRFPKYFEVETVNACNAKCIMCTIRDWDETDSSILKMDLFEKFVEEVAGHSDWIESISMNKDGEPTLDKRLPDRIKMLKDVNIKNVVFTTNGQRMTEKFARKVIEAGVDEVSFSMDGNTKEVFEKIRLQLNFDEVRNNILNFLKLRDELNPKLRVRVRMVIIPENEAEVNDFLDYWNGVLGENDLVQAQKAHTWGGQVTEEARKKIAFYADKPCISPFSSFVLHSDGRVPLCCIDYNCKHELGDFRKSSITEIWQGSRYENARQLHATGKRNGIPMCQGCDVWERDKQVDKEKILTVA